MGLIARVLEREGLPTVTMSSAHDITARIKPPRAAFLNYPLGNSVGRPEHPDEQRDILREALRLLETAQEPARIVDLGYAWPEAGWEERLTQQYEDEAHIVLNQRTVGEYHVDPTTGKHHHYAAEEARAIVDLA